MVTQEPLQILPHGFSHFVVHVHSGWVERAVFLDGLHRPERTPTQVCGAEREKARPGQLHPEFALHLRSPGCTMVPVILVYFMGESMRLVLKQATEQHCCSGVTWSQQGLRERWAPSKHRGEWRQHQALFFIHPMPGEWRCSLPCLTFHRDVLNGKSEDDGPDHSQGHLCIAIHNLCTQDKGKETEGY